MCFQLNLNEGNLSKVLLLAIKHLINELVRIQFEEYLAAEQLGTYEDLTLMNEMLLLITWNGFLYYSQNSRKCFPCGKIKSTDPNLKLKKCSTCQVFFYCSVKCENSGCMSEKSTCKSALASKNNFEVMSRGCSLEELKRVYGTKDSLKLIESQSDDSSIPVNPLAEEKNNAMLQL